MSKEQSYGRSLAIGVALGMTLSLCHGSTKVAASSEYLSADIDPVHWGELNDSPIIGSDGNTVELLPGRQVMYAPVLDGRLHPMFESGVPTAYEEALQEAVQHPVMQLAASQGVVSAVRAENSFSDNGSFASWSDEIVFVIGPGEIQDRLYHTAEDFSAIGVHEAVHAFTDYWYRYYEQGVSSGNQELDRLISSVHEACVTVNELVLSDYLSENGDALASAYEEAAGAADDYTDVPDTVGEQVTEESAADFADDLLQAAAALQADEPVVLPPSESQVCYAPTARSMVERHAEDESEVLSHVLAIDGVYFALYDHDRALRISTQEKYNCITEGDALQERYHPENPSMAGHPYDNPNEAVSSIMTILAAHPAYLSECLTATGDKPLQAAIGDLIRSIIAVTENTHPKLLEVLSQNPEAAAVIQQYA